MDLVNVAPGQCRLQRDSASQISLQRYKGAYLPLKISGVWGAKHIPASGPVLGNTGLIAATLYYIYAYENAAAISLEASATGHTPDADVGVEIKSGDPTRTLVGMVYMGAGSPGTFVDSSTQRFLANWFGRRQRDVSNVFTATRSTSSGSFVELNTEIRIEAAVWDDEASFIACSGQAYIDNVSFPDIVTAIGEDGTSPLVSVVVNSGVNNAGHDHALSIARLSAEGYHYWTLLGKTGSSRTGNWRGAADDASGRMRLSALLRI